MNEQSKKTCLNNSAFFHTLMKFYSVFLNITRSGVLKIIVTVHENHVDSLEIYLRQTNVFLKGFPTFSTSLSPHHFSEFELVHKVKK